MTELESGVPWLTDNYSQVQIEKLLLFRDSLDSQVLAAFSDFERRDLQFGLDWLTNLAATALNENEEAVIFIARSSNTDLVVCPLKIDARKGCAYSLSTFYSTSYSPIIASARPEELLIALFKHLAQVEGITTLTLAPMDNNSSVFGLIRRALGLAGWSGIHDFFCFGNWMYDIDNATYQSYIAARPSKLRNTIARKTRQFLAMNRGKLELVTGGARLEGAIDSFVTIYNASWKRSEPYPDFIPQLLRLSASRGWLRLGIASYDDIPVASQIWLVWAGTAQIFKLAYHQDYGQLSPGTVLTAYMMEYVIDTDLVSRIDYLSGDDAYKQDWMSVRRERKGVAAYNLRTLRGTSKYLGRTFNTILKTIQRKATAANKPGSGTR